MRKTKSISFDLTDSYETQLLEHAENQGKYFSRYIKRLIDRDRNNVPVAPVITTPIAQNDDLDDMNSFL